MTQRPGQPIFAVTSRRCRSVMTTLWLMLSAASWQVTGFQPNRLTRQFTTTTAPFQTYVNHGAAAQQQQQYTSSKRISTSLNMFMGSDGGILGIGTPELFTILLVGYFVLGPSDLYKIVKEVGKFIQNIRTLGTDLSTSFESNMQSQLQLEELRKAQRELNDAFSFRRSINVDDTKDAFATKPSIYKDDDDTDTDDISAAAAAVATTTGPVAAVAEPAKPRKIRRRVKKTTAEAMPDLEMPTTSAATTLDSSYSMTEDERALIEQEFDQYTGIDVEDDALVYNGDKTSKATTTAGKDDKKIDWYGAPAAADEAAAAAAAQKRFQQQLSNQWNDSVMANQDALGPLATVMNKIALLEKEKMAATKRLEEEFQKRKELEDQYYQEQRKLLEEAVTVVQQDALGLSGSGSSRVKQ